MWLQLIAWVLFSSIAIYIVCLSLLLGEVLGVLLGGLMSIYGARNIHKETRKL